MDKEILKEELSKKIDEKFQESNKSDKIKEEKNNKKEIKPSSSEKQKNNKQKNEEKKKKTLYPIIISVIIVMILIFSTIFSILNINKETIVTGVKIKGIDVSGLTQDEAKEKIETIYNEKIEKEIPIKYQEYEATINPKIIETKYEIDKAIKEAKEVGRKGNIFVNNYEILCTLIKKKDINIDLLINEEITKKTIQDIGTNLPGTVIESGYYVEKGNLKITKGKKGIIIDTNNLFEKVKKNLESPQISNEYIEIPIIEKEPDIIDLEKIHNEIYKEAKDAYYTKNPFKVYPEVEGIDFDIEEAKKILEQEKEEYEIKLKITKPKITINQIGTEAFPDQLSTFSTTFDGGNRDRTTNLEIACRKINGKVVMPGEVFSYNKTLGPRTPQAGYKNAKVYSAGQVIDGIGGGICQISSTLYHAILKANLKTVERRNHQFVTSYIDAGLDATVVYGMIDFKFKNTRKYPIKISASAKNGLAKVSIYGIKEKEEYKFSFRTETVATIPTSTRYIEDPTMPLGKEIVKQRGVNGKKTKTYMTKTLNGKIISTTVLSRDTYDAMQKIIIKGTKQTNTQPQPEYQPQPQPQPEPQPEPQPQPQPEPQPEPESQPQPEPEQKTNQENKPSEINNVVLKVE